MEKRTNPNQLKAGERLSRVSYVEVLDVSRSSMRIKNQEGLVWTIGKDIVENEFYSAAQYAETAKVSRTEMVSVLESAGDTVFTVVFEKKVTEKSIQEGVGALVSAGELSQKAIKKLAKELITGEERTLVGYLASTEPKMGRSTVVDLHVPAGKHNLRLVDHRTIKSLVLRNIKYVLK